MLFKNIKVKGRSIQILIKRPFFWTPHSGKYPKKSKWFIFRWYVWGYIELRRNFTQKEYYEWIVTGAFRND